MGKQYIKSYTLATIHLNKVYDAHFQLLINQNFYTVLRYFIPIEEKTRLILLCVKSLLKNFTIIPNKMFIGIVKSNLCKIFALT